MGRNQWLLSSPKQSKMSEYYYFLNWFNNDLLRIIYCFWYMIHFHSLKTLKAHWSNFFFPFSPRVTRKSSTINSIPSNAIWLMMERKNNLCLFMIFPEINHLLNIKGSFYLLHSSTISTRYTIKSRCLVSWIVTNSCIIFFCSLCSCCFL